MSIDPVSATYTFVFNDQEKANPMLDESLYDVFIVQPYGGGFWEVHTVQNGFKTAQVLNPTKPAGYAEAYGSNMPWAIVVPGDFKYPNEWQVIGKRASGALTGAYQTAGHSFAEWAEDSEKATDWYLHPTKGLYFE
jgi:LruC domain-containing protein